MKALLMQRDRDFDLEKESPSNKPALMQDLELSTLLGAMADGDAFLLDVAERALLSGLQNGADTILYRQTAVRDCLMNHAVVRALYDLAVEAIEAKRERWLGIFTSHPSAVLHGAIDLMQLFAGILTRLRDIAHEHAAQFESEAFRALFATLERELTHEYLASVQDHLKELRFPTGTLVSADLGRGNEGCNYVLRKREVRGWAQQLLRRHPPAFSFRIDPRDEAGGRALSELQSRGLNLAANALAQSADHILSFFQMLRVELAFYVGCSNLYRRLAAKGEPVCFPRPAAVGERRHHFTGLYDVCLSLHMDRRVVGNTVDADGRTLVIITGANQGGKSSFLRSVGLAQLMMQCGMFVGAESFEAELCTDVLTHYKREEDATMKSGKLDEELARMSDIADSLTPHSIVLFNESFAATNEREGSEIARQVVSALLEKNIRALFVTHLHEFARGLYETSMEDTLFLRAERQADGTRTFRLVPGAPLETSYGEDLYERVFAVGTRIGPSEHPSRVAKQPGAIS
jgi:hypothetical protein